MYLILNQSELATISPIAVKEMILKNCGIDAEVKRVDDHLYIMVRSIQGACEIMHRLRLDFDYSLHKRGKHYLIEI